MEHMREPEAVVAEPRYETFEELLKTGIKEYYARGWKSRKANFIALLFASGQTLSLVTDGAKSGANLKKAAIGAVSVVALRYLLRYLVGGPIGILLTGAAVASLVAFFVKNRQVVADRAERYRELIADYRVKYEQLQAGYRDNRYQESERNLMIDGMLKRLLDDLDAD
jgi:hypothetical protein